MESFLFTTKDNKKVTQNLFNPKTINAKYVANVTKSPLFVSHFEQYLNNDFVMDYEKNVEFKITKVIEKCYELIAKKNKTNDVKLYIEKNPKCK